eukprot:COSAG02_NODE_1759_length_11042_cov_3.648725_2_plen_201_part_00
MARQLSHHWLKAENFARSLSAIPVARGWRIEVTPLPLWYMFFSKKFKCNYSTCLHKCPKCSSAKIPLYHIVRTRCYRRPAGMQRAAPASPRSFLALTAAADAARAPRAASACAFEFVGDGVVALLRCAPPGRSRTFSNQFRCGRHICDLALVSFRFMLVDVGWLERRRTWKEALLQQEAAGRWRAGVPSLITCVTAPAYL